MMRWVKRGVAGLIGVLGLLVGAPTWADAGGCPARYEAVVDAYSGWITCVPKARGQGANGGDAGPPPLADLFMAVVGHPFTPQLWVASGYLQAAGAEQVALNACRSAMDAPNDCTRLITAHNSQYVGTVRTARGVPFVSSGDSIANASAGAMRVCQKESDSCREGAVLYNTLNQSERFPALPVKEYLAATIAVPAKASATAKGKPWLVSGRPSSQSIPQALSQCQQVAGTPCQVLRHTGGGVLGRLRASDGYDYFVDAWDTSWLENNVDQLCPAGLKCRLTAIYDAKTAENKAIE